MAKESRLAEIFRQELKKDKGLMAAFLTSAGERAKEKSDIRSYLPKSGITGAITERMFGKPYRAGSKDSKVERTGDISSSKYIPGMAKDMNLMRLNMQKMVTIWGGKPSKSVSTNMLKGKETKIKEDDKSSGIMGGIMGGLGSIGGGLLGVLGSLGGGLLSLGGSMISGIATLIGGIGGGLFSIVGGALGAMGPLGLLLAAGAGFLIYGLSQSLDFDKLKKDFDKIYQEVKKSIKDFFGISDDSTSSISEQFAAELDSFFGGNTFTTSLNFINDTFEDLSDKIGSVASGSFAVIENIFKSVALDLIAITTDFYTQYRTALMVIGGAKFGAAFGPIGAAVGAVGGLVYSEATRTVGTSSNAAIERSLEASKNAQNKAKNKFAKGKENFDPKTYKYPDADFGTMDVTLDEKIKILEDELAKRKTGRTNAAVSGAQNLYQSYQPTTADVDDKQHQRDIRNGRQSQEIQKRTDKKATTEKSPTKIGKDAEAMKQLIYDKFIAAGFTPEQAQGAIANAIEESRLNPNAYYKTATEESVGLFQLNRKGGVGTGHSVQDLQDPNKNIDLIIAAAKKSPSFMAAKTADEATRTFMTTVERPADQSENAQQKRLANLVKSVPDKNLAPNTKEAETKVASYYDQMVALLGALVETTSGTTAAVGAAASATQKSNTKMESPYNDELYPLLLQMHASDLASG